MSIAAFTNCGLHGDGGQHRAGIAVLADLCPLDGAMDLAGQVSKPFEGAHRLVCYREISMTTGSLAFESLLRVAQAAGKPDL